MNADAIVTIYVVIDDILEAMNLQDDSRTQLSSAEILTVAVVAAQQFQNHHERALGVLHLTGYIAGFSVSRFNRRLRALKGVLSQVLLAVSELVTQGQLFIVDTLPIPICKWARFDRCRKLEGKQFVGYCASKDEYFFGWHLHLVCDQYGIPVSFDLLPARWDELNPLQHLLAPLPEGSQVVADKGYISDKDQQLAYIHGQVRLIPRQRRNMAGNTPEDLRLIRRFRPRIETLFSQLEKMGVQRLHARTNDGIAVKILASLLAVTFTNSLN